MQKKFNVKISSCFSNLFDVTSLEPQGIKLGPLLYIIYANDIADIFKFANIKMYADNLTIYAALNNESGRKTLQFELNLLCELCDKWGLTINFNKCKLIHFGNGNLYFPYKLGSVDFINSECEKIFGVLIDSSLSYCNHVYSYVKKASQAYNVILSNMFFVNNET